MLGYFYYGVRNHFYCTIISGPAEEKFGKYWYRQTFWGGPGKFSAKPDPAAAGAEALSRHKSPHHHME